MAEASVAEASVGEAFVAGAPVGEARTGRGRGYGPGAARHPAFSSRFRSSLATAARLRAFSPRLR